MKICIKEKLTDNVFGAVWLAALIMTYQENRKNSSIHELPLSQSEIQKIAQQLCSKTVQSARISQWCNGDHPQSSYNYLRQCGRKERRLTKAGEFNNSKEHPECLLNREETIFSVVDFNENVTFGELMDWYMKSYSKCDFSMNSNNNLYSKITKSNKNNFQYTKTDKLELDLDGNKLQLLDVSFTKVNITFDYYDKENMFSLLDTSTLLETVQKPRYQKYYTIINNKYNQFLTMKMGGFLKSLKDTNDDFYKDFLNPYGDAKYCKFKINDESIYNKKGLYLYLNNGKIMYIGRCRDNFYNRFNSGYGNISPKNCYLDGQATNCHINSIVNGVRENVELYISALEDDEEITMLERMLIHKYKPEWNITLK